MWSPCRRLRAESQHSRRCSQGGGTKIGRTLGHIDEVLAELPGRLSTNRAFGSRGHTGLVDAGAPALMGAAGWIIAGVGAWAVIRNNGPSGSRLAGGASWMPATARRFWGIILVVFGACLIVVSIVV